MHLKHQESRTSKAEDKQNKSKTGIDKPGCEYHILAARLFCWTKKSGNGRTAPASIRQLPQEMRFYFLREMAYDPEGLAVAAGQRKEETAVQAKGSFHRDAFRSMAAKKVASNFR